MTVEQQIWESFLSDLDRHAAHKWRQVGRCVYCECGTRLYQGTLPKDRQEPKPQPREPKTTTDMRQRWGKD